MESQHVSQADLPPVMAPLLNVDRYAFTARGTSPGERGAGSSMAPTPYFTWTEITIIEFGKSSMMSGSKPLGGSFFTNLETQYLQRATGSRPSVASPVSSWRLRR